MMDDQGAVYAALAQAHADGTPAALATVISTSGSMPRHAGSKMLIYRDGSLVGTVGGGAMENQVINAAQQVIENSTPQTATYTLNNLDDGDPGICGGTATIFIEPIGITPTLLVIGGGHVGQALTQLGKWMGFTVILSDDRPEFCNVDVAPDADQYAICSPATLTEHVAITAQTYIAAVTRGLPIDDQLLPSLLNTDAAYIGLIGSRRRWAITMKQLREKHGLTDAQLQRIRAPIGLEIEAETPKEIALSIMAEITMIRRGGTGTPMQWHGRLSDIE